MSAHQIPWWKSTLRSSIVVAVNNNHAESIVAIEDIIASSYCEGNRLANFHLIPPEHISIHPDSTMPQIHLDQVNIMAYQDQVSINGTLAWSDPHQPSFIRLSIPFIL